MNDHDYIEECYELLHLAKVRLDGGAALIVTVWDSNDNGDRHRVTVDLYYTATDGKVTRMGITYALFVTGTLDKAKPNRAFGNKHMAVFVGGGTPVASGVVSIIERALDLPDDYITNWVQA
jgi:hypothetical protein